MSTGKGLKDEYSKRSLSAIHYHVTDWIFSLFFFFPSMVCYWRGIWDLYTTYVFRGQEFLSAWTITGIGSAFILAYFLYPIVNKCIRHLPRVMRGLMVRLTLYLGGILAMGYWRGVWGVLDYYLLPYGWKGGAVGLAISYPILALLGVSRNVIFPPFVVSMDSRPDALVPATRFHTKLRADFRIVILYLLDSLFTHFFILTMTIVVWRSMLTLIAAIPFPNMMGDFICFGVGIFAVIILYLLEIPIALLGRKLVPSGGESADVEAAEIDATQRDGGGSSYTNTNRQSSLLPEYLNTQLPPSDTQSTVIESVSTHRDRPLGCFSRSKLTRFKLQVYEDLVFLIVFTCEAFLWIGAWNLNATYIISDPMMGGWINHALGSFLLITLGLMSYGGFCGCASDDPVLASASGFTTNEFEYIYPIRYIRVIVEETIFERLGSSRGSPSGGSSLPSSTVVADCSSDNAATISASASSQSLAPPSVISVRF